MPEPIALNYVLIKGSCLEIVKIAKDNETAIGILVA